MEITWTPLLTSVNVWNWTNAETIEMMMQAEAERSRTNQQMLEILDGFRQQNEKKIDLMKKLAEKDDDPSTSNK